MAVSFPNETAEYRHSRNALLTAETKLRSSIEDVARLRRSLPAGGEIPRDYVFTTLDGAQAPLSSLFTHSERCLAIYSLMYGPNADAPCPMCTSLLDGLNGCAAHIEQRMNFAIVASTDAGKLSQLQQARGWKALRLFSAQGSTYQRDYHGQSSNGDEYPIMNVFIREGGAIRHFWGSEGFFADVDGQPRHMDLIWPLWNMLDMTPQGRGDSWYPALRYE